MIGRCNAVVTVTVVHYGHAFVRHVMLGAFESSPTELNVHQAVGVAVNICFSVIGCHKFLRKPGCYRCDNEYLIDCIRPKQGVGAVHPTKLPACKLLL
jgi:hypothetical protein